MVSGFQNQLLEQTLPQYNLIKHDKGKYELELAAMGFDKDEITVKLKGSNLLISGQKKQKSDSSIFVADYEYLHNKLFFNSFSRSWSMDAGLSVTKISLKNGILSVLLEKEASEEADTQYIKLSIE
jgi:HSP20 family molecular chaperone IbpA